MPGQEFSLEVNPHIPDELARLPELADNVWYSWNRSARALFRVLNPRLWQRCGHNPKRFLRSVDESTLQRAAEDPVFLASYQQVMTAFDMYHGESARCPARPDFEPDDLIAYFCAEYGFHESVPIYSGGLGILAGDHCKSASDMRMPFIGVGLLYRQGYFTQHIDGEGNQHALYHDTELEELPVEPALDAGGEPIAFSVRLPGRDVALAVWVCRVGHVRLYLLDSNLEGNSPEDREITHQLYGGGLGTRMRQEIVLGIGGVRALRLLGIRPTVWHVNEGHAAFMLLERVRERVEGGLAFAEALEVVASGTVFTTHTPVPAGHDVFPADMIRKYFAEYAPGLGVSVDALLALGMLPGEEHSFNMTTLALNLSRHQNGVSRIHGRVSSEICATAWPQIQPQENPLGYVTNGVHIPSFLDQAWCDLFDRFLGAGWRNHFTDVGFWSRIDDIPDHLFWSVSQSIKSQMCYFLQDSLRRQHRRNHMSEVHLERLLRFIDPRDPNVLVVGFARRFATYKRAPLLMHDLDWLREIVCQDARPVVFVFAGKAHPADGPGQDLLRQIHLLSAMPEFVGRILLVEGYDLALARRLVAGVDVWLNNPIYPQEASGTSGMKAAINGSLNLSVLDGWWAEGYDGANGWGIKPSPYAEDDARRDREDARTLYEILQDDVLPVYYERSSLGYSPEWVRKCKRSMKTILPRFNTCRMLNEYGRNLYGPASRQARALTEEDYAGARELARWKARVREAWPGVHFAGGGRPALRTAFGEAVELEAEITLNGLDPGDLAVELLLSRAGGDDTTVGLAGALDGEGYMDRPTEDRPLEVTVAERLAPVGPGGQPNTQRYRLELRPDWCGRLVYRIRAFPHHPLLTHPHEMGLMVWL